MLVQGVSNRQKEVVRSRTLVALMLLVCVPAPAQIVTGSIGGTVVDPSGLTAPGAEATLVQAATGAQVNSRLGRFTGAINARIMQFALRFYF